MKKSFSLVSQVGLISAIVFVIFAYMLSRFVANFVRRDFQAQTEKSVSEFLEKQVDSFLNPTNFEHRNRTTEDIAKEYEIFDPFVSAIETDDVIKTRIWDNSNTIIYSYQEGEIYPEDINKTFADNHEYQSAMSGIVNTEISKPVTSEDEALGNYKEFMEVYIPVYLIGRETPVGVAEVYYKLDRLNSNIWSLNKNIFMITGGAFLLLYLILLAITKRASDTIISQNKEIEESQKREIEKSNELNEVLRLLNKTLRHDLLNDMSIVTGNIDSYFEYGEEKVAIKGVLEEAQKSMKRGIDFIGKMKELESALASGRPLGKIEAKSAIEEVAKEFSDLQFEINGSVEVMADGAFGSMIQNLFRNAKIHGKTKRVTVNMNEDNEKATIEIADFGKGIPDEIKNKLFTEGFKYGEKGHTGLGLFIVKKTVERYGGNISVKDNTPNGAIFVISLPKS